MKFKNQAEKCFLPTVFLRAPGLLLFILLFRGGGLGGLDPLAFFVLDEFAFGGLGTDLFGAEFADLVGGGALLLADGGVNGLAVLVFVLNELLFVIGEFDFLACRLFRQGFEVAGLVLADGTGLFEDFDLRLAVGHVLLDGGGGIGGGKRLRDSKSERESGDGESDQFFHGKNLLRL